MSDKATSVIAAVMAYVVAHARERRLVQSMLVTEDANGVVDLTPQQVMEMQSRRVECDRAGDALIAMADETGHGNGAAHRAGDT